MRLCLALALILVASTAMAADYDGPQGQDEDREQYQPPGAPEDGTPCYNEMGEEGTWHGDRCYTDNEL